MHQPDSTDPRRLSTPSSLTARLLTGWRTAFPTVADELERPGTSVIGDPERRADGAVVLWPCTPRVVAETRPDLVERLRAHLDERPADHRLTVAEVRSMDVVGHAPTLGRDLLYVLDRDRFRPPALPDGVSVEVLGGRHRGAFDALLAACSEDDRDEADIGMDAPNELAVGVLAGERLLAAASMYPWRGFSDLGVLTDPAARRRGAGALAVAGVCQQLLSSARPVVYRHDDGNLGSRGIARALGLVPVGEILGVWPEP